MKTLLYFTRTLFIFVIFAFISNSFAQDTDPEYVVRQIYFHPSDTPIPDRIDTQLDELVNEVQTFYADEMERHGFGRKTFRLETDAQGNQVRHYVEGKFTKEHYVNNITGKANEEIFEQFDRSAHLIYLIFVNTFDPIHEFSHVSGSGGGSSFEGSAAINLINFENVPESLYTEAWKLIGHELGHAFGLLHDFRDDRNILSYGPDKQIDQLSYCAAEWLDFHRYFNTTHNRNIIDRNLSVRMLEPTFVSSPNTIRLRFNITHSAGLHQAQLLTERYDLPAGVNPLLLDCKSLNGSNTTIEFITTELFPVNEQVMLQVIDVHGNFKYSIFPIDITSLIPRSEAISIPDKNLEAAIREELGIARGTDITQLDMHGLRAIEVFIPLNENVDNPIADLTGLQHATNLQHLSLRRQHIVDLTPLAGLKELKIVSIGNSKIRDISSLARLPNLRNLSLDRNQIRDISPLAELTQLRSLILDDNQIEDIMPIKGLTNLEQLWLHQNKISDITPLKNLTNLNELILGLNQISDITSLKDMTNLHFLSIGGNQIRDVSPLVGLVNLEYLYLAGNPIKNQKPLLALLRKNPDIKIFLKNNREPLPVTLSSFRAEHSETGVILNWTTESEIDNAGFYIYRSETKEGEFKVVNPSMIQGAGTTGERNAYTWTDTTAKPNTVYYYRIEDISHAGKRKQLATVRLRGLVSPKGKMLTQWAHFKTGQ